MLIGHRFVTRFRAVLQAGCHVLRKSAEHSLRDSELISCQTVKISSYYFFLLSSSPKPLSRCYVVYQLTVTNVARFQTHMAVNGMWPLVSPIYIYAPAFRSNLLPPILNIQPEFFSETANLSHYTASHARRQTFNLHFSFTATDIYTNLSTSTT